MRYTYLECMNGHRYRNKREHNFADCPICGSHWKRRITQKMWVQLNENGWGSGNPDGHVGRK